MGWRKRGEEGGVKINRGVIPTAFSPLGGPMCPHKKKKINRGVGISKYRLISVMNEKRDINL